MKTHGRSGSNPVYDEALLLYQNGNFAEAVDKLNQVPKQGRTENRYRLLLGTALARLNQTQEAIELFAKALKDDPNCFDALTWLAALTKNPQAIDKAIGYAKRAIALRPNDSSGWGTLGTCYLVAKEPLQAIEALNKALERDPSVPEHHHNMAQALLQIDRHHDAIPALQRAIELDPEAPQNYLLLASVYTMFGMAGDALVWLNKGLARFPRNATIHTTIANCYAMLRNDEKAESHYRQAIAITSAARSAYGTWLINQGRFDESSRIFERILAEGEDPCFAYYSLMLGRKLKDNEQDLEFLGRMEKARQKPIHRSRSEMYLHYALGRAYEQLRKPEQAMASFDRANDLANQTFRAAKRVPASRFLLEHEQSREYFERLNAAELKPHESDKPIFIIGMIRSGTTLLDQIVSSHPMVQSGGELRYWIEESKRMLLRDWPLPSNTLIELSEEYVTYAQLLAGPNERFTDKMPLNYMYAGIIHKAMPNARFVHIRRNPVDTCLSIWTTFFGQGPIFAYDKQNIVTNYLEYRKMMAWLGERLPADRLHEIDYEELIANPEPTIRGVIEFLDLPWDDSCLHHDKNTSAINTPSRWQARQPIYKSSMERWRAYEPWLGEFAQLIGLP